MSTTIITNTLTRIRSSIGIAPLETAIALFEKAVETYDYDDLRMQAVFDLKNLLYESNNKLGYGKARAVDIIECVKLMSKAEDMLRIMEGSSK